MTFQLLTERISFLTKTSVSDLAQTMISIAKIEVERTLLSVQNDTFDFKAFSLTNRSKN